MLDIDDPKIETLKLFIGYIFYKFLLNLLNLFNFFYKVIIKSSNNFFHNSNVDNNIYSINFNNEIQITMYIIYDRCILIN